MFSEHHNNANKDCAGNVTNGSLVSTSSKTSTLATHNQHDLSGLLQQRRWWLNTVTRYPEWISIMRCLCRSNATDIPKRRLCLTSTASISSSTSKPSYYAYTFRTSDIKLKPNDRIRMLTYNMNKDVHVGKETTKSVYSDWEMLSALIVNNKT